jgi:outer membrane protein TolC
MAGRRGERRSAVALWPVAQLNCVVRLNTGKADNPARAMERGTMRVVGARAFALASAIAAAVLLAGCSMLGPAGDGGWNPERREAELERARAMSGVPAAALPDDLGPGQPLPRTIDLTTALDLASRHNRSMKAAEASVDAAAGSVAVARSALLPSHQLRGNWSWYSDEQTNSVEFTLPDGTQPVVTVREDSFGTAGAAVRLALDFSGELRHGLYAAQAGYRAEQARAWATRLEEETSVLAAYFGLLEAERLREVAVHTVALHEKQLRDAKSRLDQGRLTKNEVLVVDVALATTRQLVLQLENAIHTARRRLNRTTGLPVGAPTEARDVGGRPDLPDVAKALEAARVSNPLVASMLEEVRAADERLTAAKRSRFPRVSGNAGYDATTADTLDPNNYGTVGVNVDFDLYSFGREGEIARLDAASRQSRLLLDRSVREVEILVRDSHDRVRERLAAIDAATVAVGQADENLRIRQVQFNEGRATSEDLLDAAELAARQRGQLASALYQAHTRRAELQQLMGAPLADLAVVRSPASGARTLPPPPPVRSGDAIR